ncbi:ArsC family (seleno)protein [Thalassoglobus sp. JC818]|uniref:ArsC family (seleno)protein n=1 Tax=Thalassoglobus sp. JC818 TaxID=3232136 RepID=UPI003459F3CB
MASKVDWYYRRSGCTTCKKMDAFLEEHSIVPKETSSANKERRGPEAAFELVETVSKVIAARGKSVVEFKTKGADEELLKKHLLGPTGNLRSPIVRKGKTLYVGFNNEAFAESLVK